ncbi:MAG: azurin [Rhodanobacter sp.]|jgi:azurin|nr:azurin [Rhodanobacter sp.]
MKLQIFALMLLGLVAAPTWAATGCSTTVQGNDMLRFNKSSIQVPKTCTTFTVTLDNVGSMPRSVMGHNVVIAPKADEESIINDGATAGLDDDYVKPNDNRVIAHTKLIGGGETASTTFKVSAFKPGVTYSFFCTCPGHASLMRGAIVLK